MKFLIPPGIPEILDILDKTQNGPVCSPQEWDTRVIAQAAASKLKEHGLEKSCDKDNPVNQDDGLADEFFEAGYELAVELGFLCIDTERVVKLSEEELKKAIERAPSSLTLGLGKDATSWEARRPEDGRVPKLGAPLGIAVSEAAWLPLMQAIAEQREVDFFQGGSIVQILGREVKSATPYETVAGRLNAEWHNEAMQRAGRPDIGATAVISSVTALGQFGGFGMPGGFDPKRDIALVLSPAELKTSYASMNKVINAIACGGRILAGGSSMLGGFGGGAEASVLLMIAGALLEIPVHQSKVASRGVIDVRYNGNTGPEGIWALSVSTQAMSRNTKLITRKTVNQTAGPCTDMLLYESAVGLATISCSGVSITIAPRSAGGRYTDYLTPLECKFCGEIFHTCGGMKRSDLNEIVRKLIPKYESTLGRPPKGKSFNECYDIETHQPSREWLAIYERVKKEVMDLGIPLKEGLMTQSV